MNKIMIFFFLCLLLVGCNNGSKNNSMNVNSCAEPQNPYSDGTGHYAGYNWAQENGEECDGNSESFIEGCEEYYEQQDQYNSCLSEGKA